MINKVGIFRNGDDLASAVDELEACLDDCRRASLTTKVAGMNPELSAALRLEGMLRLAIVTAIGARDRTESRGAHFRSDYPLRDDARWLNRTLARWPDGADRPELSYEPVGLLDMPPGHRGYGSAEWKRLDIPVDDYNRDTEAAQRRAGRAPDRSAFGSRLRWGQWQTNE